MVLSGPSLMRQVSSDEVGFTGEGAWSSQVPHDEAGIIYVLEKVDGSLRSLTDEAGIICELEKVDGFLRSITDEARII